MSGTEPQVYNDKVADGLLGREGGGKGGNHPKFPTPDLVKIGQKKMTTKDHR